MDQSKQLKHPDPNLVGTPGWICDFCATERRGVMFKTGSTASGGIKCGYCNDEFRVEQYIYPSVDYLWPSQIARYADGGRMRAERIARQYADGWTNLYDHESFDGANWPTPEEIDALRELKPSWKHFYNKELDRIQKLWGFK